MAFSLSGLLAPVGCPELDSAKFYYYFFKCPLSSLRFGHTTSFNMTISYGRSFLLSARYWWIDLPLKIKPVVPTQWNELKSNGLVRPSTGKRSSAHSKLRENLGKTNATCAVNNTKSKDDMENCKRSKLQKILW